jgi:hypothetical protein
VRCLRGSGLLGRGVSAAENGEEGEKNVATLIVEGRRGIGGGGGGGGEGGGGEGGGGEGGGGGSEEAKKRRSEE